MKLIANRQLTGTYGTVTAGQTFEVEDATAVQLITQGVAHKADPPRVEYQTKVIKPEAPEVSPREPFRDSLMPYEEPAAVAPESNRIVPQSDIPERRDVDRRRRRGRPRSGS
ncbi:MAG TPA: hypothetical protein VK638_44825 [Edaphobacter sp.]|nr:hypothetical protein [Edaphobacter sp.]